MKRFRLLIGVLLLSSFGIAAALALVEGVFHLLPGLLPVEVQQQVQASPKTMGVSHPYIGNLQTPNREGVIWGSDFRATHHTDAHGFRNPSPWPEQADIVVVGDSLVFGYGVEDDQAWPALLAQAAPQLHLINLGLIGASPQQSLRVYETFGVPLRPQLLLVGFFAANDFWDAGLFDQWLRSGVGGHYLVWRDFGRNAPPDSGALPRLTPSAPGSCGIVISTISCAFRATSTSVGARIAPGFSRAATALSCNCRVTFGTSI